MRNKKLKAAVIIAMVCMLFGGCSRFDAGVYTQAVLDASYKNQTEDYIELTETAKEDAEAFSGSVSAAMLLHEIQRELPAFQPYIKQRDLRQVLLVQAAMDNIRIQRQNGLFFLCGNYASDDEELQSVLRNKLLHHEGKQMVFYIKKKEQLLEELKLVHMSHKDLYGNLQEAAWDIMHSAR